MILKIVNLLAGSLGLSRVSMFAAESVKKHFDMSSDSQPVAIACLGQVAEFYSKPLLKQQLLTEHKHLSDLLFENSWNLPCR